MHATVYHHVRVQNNTEKLGQHRNDKRWNRDFAVQSLQTYELAFMIPQKLKIFYLVLEILKKIRIVLINLTNFI